MFRRYHTTFAVIGAVVLPATLVAQAKVLTADDYARAEKALGFATAPLVSRLAVQPNWLPEGRFWYRVRQPDGSSPMILVNPATGAKTNCATTPAACPGVPAPAAPGARRAGPPESLSPDGKSAVFIRNWNLWLREVATNKETQLNTDGVKDFGYATDNAGWIHSDRPIVTWSPDSRRIATFQQDQRGVGEMYLVRTNVNHPELMAWKYPLPGDSVVSMIYRVVVDLTGPKPAVVRLKTALVAPDAVAAFHPRHHRSPPCPRRHRHRPLRRQLQSRA